MPHAAVARPRQVCPPTTVAPIYSLDQSSQRTRLKLLSERIKTCSWRALVCISPPRPSQPVGCVDPGKTTKRLEAAHYARFSMSRRYPEKPPSNESQCSNPAPPTSIAWSSLLKRLSPHLQPAGVSTGVGCREHRDGVEGGASASSLPRRAILLRHTSVRPDSLDSLTKPKRVEKRSMAARACE